MNVDDAAATGSRLPAAMLERLVLPVIAAPMFLVWGPALVEAACRAGFIGAWGNKLKPSLVRAGLDPDNLQPREGGFDLSRGQDETRAWKDLWSAGHGVGQIKAIEPVRAVVERLRAEYAAALNAELSDPWIRRHRSEPC